jgi:hypothetical protein
MDNPETKVLVGGKARAWMHTGRTYTASWECDTCNRGWQTYVAGEVNKGDVLTIATDHLTDHILKGHTEDGR